MFDGTVISKMDTSVDDEVDVEDDGTALYGPAQYPPPAVPPVEDACY